MQLAELGAALKAAGTEGRRLRRALGVAIRAEVEPMKQAEAAAIQAIPSSTGGDPSARLRRGADISGLGLRAAMTRSLRVTVRATLRRTSVELSMAPSRMPSGEDVLPARMDGRGKWVHPVFGDRKVWVTQQPHPFFARTAAPYVEKTKLAIRAAVARISADLNEVTK
ncbi:MAG TPA: hypothetical protein VN088_16250 [Nocardioides sp.]|nr:hypothetical protein [Nocardioides sp.]